MTEGRAYSWALRTTMAVGLLGLASAASGRELSLAEALRLAEGASLQIKGARADLGGQEAKTTAAWLDLGPQIVAGYNAVYFDEAITVPFGAQTLVMRDKESKTGSLTLTQPLTGLFALQQKAKFEGSMTTMRELGLEEATRQTAFQTATAYLGAQRAEKQRSMVQARVDAVKSQLRDGEALLAAGRIHSADLLKMKVALSQAQADLARANAEREISLFALREKIGLVKELDLTLPPMHLPEKPRTSELPELEAAIAQAVAQRVDMAQAERGIEVAAYGSKLVYARFSPAINFFAKYDKNFGEVSFGSQETTKSYGIQLTWQLWDNGSRFYSLAEASEQTLRAETSFAEAKQRVRLDVMSALAMLKAGQESYEMARMASEQAQEAYRIEKAKFSSGRSTATELILAEATTSAAGAGQLDAYTQLCIQDLKLQQAMGARGPKL